MVRYALTGDLLGELSRNWWVVVLRGAAAVLFGLIALVWPGVTLVALAIVFGVYALVDGAALGYAAYRAAPGSRGSLAAQAVVSVLLGLIALIWPVAFGMAVVLVIGAWAVITGVAEIVTAIRLRAHISSEWLLIFVGALSVVFGLLLWFWPLEGAQAIVFVVGVYAIIFGVVMAVAGFRLRGAHAAVRDGDGDGAPLARDEPRPAEEGSGLTAFDDGYAGGYADGYRGDERTGPDDAGPEGTDGEGASRRSGGGRHRAPRERPEDPE
ncbi:DUF308 domain-containing protein [Nocardiopsis sp. ARC36]